jgi:UDP-N-acetylmuramoylalanine--D-glutamate ligase
MDLYGKHVLVVGLARSGLAVARFLKGRGALVTITDQAAETGLGGSLEQARQLGVALELGGHRAESWLAADLIVISPGVPHTLDPLCAARQRGVPVIGEVELAARYIQRPILAVTGTNGKTTTTELLGRMLASSGRRVFVGGNIGNPLIEIVDRDDQLDAIVAEISSFQLDTIDTFKPHVAVLLNITPDHLDRYADLEAYAASKARIFENQTEDDFAVCNGNDPLVQQQCGSIPSQRFSFFNRPPENGGMGNGAVITPIQVAFVLPGSVQGRVDLSRCRLTGPHNRENIAAACLAALAFGADPAGIQKAVDQFQGLDHRMESVATVNGVSFVNDSKATNVDAVVRALECFDSPVILIMGGRNKGYDFSPLDSHIRRRVKRLILYGEAGPEIQAVLGNSAIDGSERTKDLSQAVSLAYAQAAAGDTVLLSPACASFDLFGSYAERGESFRRLVKELM